MFGSREGEGVLNVSFFQLIDPDFHEFVIRLWNLRAGNSDPWTYALYGKRIDGSDFPYRCTSVSLNMPDQKATFVYLIDLSVVAAPPTREELHAENARLLTELEERADT